MKQLKYFARIVELESITAAAQALYVAQPSLSQHVANLSPSWASSCSTEARTVRADQSRRTALQPRQGDLCQLEDAAIAVKQESNDPAGHVSLGLPTSTSRLVAVDLMSEITRQHKQISLEIVESALADLPTR